LQHLKSTEIEPSLQSDHSIITLNISFSNFSHKSGLWKHNNSLLSDIVYVKEINTKIDDIKLQYALPIYNHQNINEIPDSELQLTISDQLFFRNSSNGTKRQVYFIWVLYKKGNKTHRNQIIN